MSDYSFGNRYGKPDIERLGLFSEMGYMNGSKYVPLGGKPIYLKGYNFITSGRKSKNATQHGYFDDEYKRLYIGEAIVRKPKGKARPPLAPFIVNSLPKKHSTPGDNYGTFTKSTEHFSAKTKTKSKFVHEPPNFVWRTGKIGGPGYADTGMDKYPEHLPDPYGRKPKHKEYGKMLDGPLLNAIYPAPYFDANGPFTDDKLPTVGLYLNRDRKKSKNAINPLWIPNGPPKSQGGSHAGCFEHFPEFMPCKYVTMPEANKARGTGKQSGPPMVPIPVIPKTHNTRPIIDATVDIFMNMDNAQTYVPCYIKYLQVPLL